MAPGRRSAGVGAHWLPAGLLTARRRSRWAAVASCSLPLWLGVPLPIRRHVEVALPGGPLLILLYEQRPQQTHDRFAVGKDADDAFSATRFLIEPFNRIGGA